jgi:hypothetical protein
MSLMISSYCPLSVKNLTAFLGSDLSEKRPCPFSLFTNVERDVDRLRRDIERRC